MYRARQLLRSSVIVIALLGLGKLTGLIRTRLVSTTFGTTPAFDAFTAANQLPEYFVTVISGGALAAAFIPVYMDYLAKQNRRETALLANSILNLVIIFLGGISLVGIIFAPWLVDHILVPNFSPEQKALTASLMRIILLQTTLFGVSGVLSSILNAHQHFALPALAPVALDIGYLIGLFFFVPNIGIRGLAWGTVVGGVLHILIQVPALIRYGFRYAVQLVLKLSGVWEIILLMIPRMITLSSVQFVDLFIIRLTSALPSGSTSGYFYGYYLMQLPETLLGTAIAIVVFPTMSELFNAGDIEGLKRLSMTALRIIWTLTIPASALLILLGRPAISLFLEQGAFTGESTQLVFSILVFFSVRIISEASLEILARLFYAQHDTITPMFIVISWLSLNITFAFSIVQASNLSGFAFRIGLFLMFVSLTLFMISRIHVSYLYHRDSLIKASSSSLWAAGTTLFGSLLLVLNYKFSIIQVNDVRGIALASTIAFTVQSLVLFIINRKRIGYLYERELIATGARSLVGVVGMTITISLLNNWLTGTLSLLAVGGILGLTAYFLIGYALGAREVPDLIRLVRRNP